MVRARGQLAHDVFQKFSQRVSTGTKVNHIDCWIVDKESVNREKIVGRKSGVCLAQCALLSPKKETNC